mmetsp:Transcript_19539/g.14248  ORF Transcript_19539/g.14248 Transcript_19539/m.14248 type:complete len:142 (+) Transcript_19539:252-677(+)
MDYLSCEVAKSKVLTIKARILKAVALIEIGYLNEAFQLYSKLLALKDLPRVGSRESEFISKKEGRQFNLPPTQRFYNHLPPEHEKNQEAMQFMLKPVPADLLLQFKKVLSPYVLELLNFLRALFLVRAGESENVEAPDKND